MTETESFSVVTSNSDVTVFALNLSTHHQVIIDFTVDVNALEGLAYNILLIVFVDESLDAAILLLLGKYINENDQ